MGILNQWQGWQADVLNAIGAPVNAATLNFLNAWQSIEGDGGNYNPLNSTQPAPGSWPLAGNPDGVQNYPNAIVGAAATAKTMLNGYYNNIVSALRSGNPCAYASSLGGELSTWGSGPAVVTKACGGGGGNNNPPPLVASTGSSGSQSAPVNFSSQLDPHNAFLIVAAIVGVLIVALIGGLHSGNTRKPALVQ